jgi:hypothetical protein
MTQLAPDHSQSSAERLADACLLLKLLVSRELAQRAPVAAFRRFRRISKGHQCDRSQMGRGAEYGADACFVERAHPAGCNAQSTRSQLRIGRSNGGILDAEQCSAARAILGCAVTLIGQEGEHDRRL